MEQLKPKGQNGFSRFMNSYSIIFVTIIMIIAATIAAQVMGGDNLGYNAFLNGGNVINILRNNSIIGIPALGMSFVIITGEIDLACGSQLVIVGLVIVNVLNATTNIPLAIICGIAISVGISAGTGFIIAKGRVPSFIVTLGMQYVLRSLAIFFMDARGVTAKVPEYQMISNTDVGGVVPMPIIFFAGMFILFFFISRKTVLGRRIYAVGSNERATKLCGINTDKVKIMAFILLGIAITVASITESSRMNSVNSSSTGTGYELTAIAMAVVGGISMQGGKGSLIGTLFGMLILGIINNILTIVGMDVYLVNCVKGAIIIFAVLTQRKDTDR